MAYRIFSSAEDARKQGFMSASNLADRAMADSSAFVKMDLQQRRAAEKKLYTLFSYVSDAVQSRMLNAPADVAQIIIAGNRIPISSWGCLREGGLHLKGSVFTEKTREQISNLVALIAKWKPRENQKCSGALHGMMWDKLVHEVIRAFLEKKTLPNGYNPIDDFFVRSDGLLSTSMSAREAKSLSDSIVSIQENEWRPFASRGVNNYQWARGPIDKAYQARLLGDELLREVEDVVMPVSGFQYMFSSSHFVFRYNKAVKDSVASVNASLLRGISARKAAARRVGQSLPPSESNALK